MVVNDCNKIKKIILSLLILSGLMVSLYSQDKKISGIVNIYKHVTAIGPGTDNVTLSDVSGLQAKDTILLIQMKGAVIYTDESNSYGTMQDSIGSPGRYEFLIIQSVNSVTKVVVFTNPILNSFNVKGILQLVRVPYYNSATVTANLTCQPWDSISKTGGVLAIIVGRTLSLNADIEVTGKGFYGGAASLGDGFCTVVNTTLYDKYSYPASFTNSGFKGESQVIKVWLDASNKPSYYPGYAKGKGSNFTGGGGANGKFAGGGGGSNYGSGGKGGVESNSCGAGNQSGNGLQIRTVKASDLDGGLFFGGGGGASTYLAGSTSSSGGRGGGIVIIMSDTLKGNGKIIKADGDWPSILTTGNAGAGGGGGGGSIALYQQSFSSLVSTASSALIISAKGGNGGNTSNQFGEGGGGGGGLILTNNLTFPPNVIRTASFGTVGTKAGGSLSGSSGSDGDNLTTFAPVLNGFLFNSIRSSVTGDQTDSICSDVSFGVISGTKPVGGVAPYTYFWESSITSETGPWIPAVGTNNQSDYSPGLLTQTTWFRRTVIDNGALTDVSKAVKIIVHQAITGNLVGKDTTICFNQNPLPLVPLNSGPANGSSYNYYLYSWKQNLTNANWDTSPDADGTSANEGYDPPALTQTTYYQRKVTSGRCVSYSSTVTVTVLPLITGNITTRPDSVICEGSLFNQLGATIPEGGDNIPANYKYQWQESLNATFWNPAFGVNTPATYTPDVSTFAVEEKRYYRRVVFSGPDSVCKNASVPILMTRYHKILNNNILSTPQTICSGSIPTPITASVPTQGSGIYTYIWQDSIKTGVWTTRGTTDFTHTPGALTDTTWYRRIVNSSKCTNKSLPVIVNVHKPLANFNITRLDGNTSDTTICNSQTPHLIKGTVATGGTEIAGSYIYQWKYSTDNTTFIPVPSGGTGISYQPPPITVKTYYKREVTSGSCTETSNTITVLVLPLITNNNISANQTICYNTAPLALTGNFPSGGDGAGTYTYLWEESSNGGTIWTAAVGTNNDPSGDYAPPALTVPMKYRRTVTSGLSGCCTSVSNVVDISQFPPLPTGKITNISDTTICGGLSVLLKIELTGTSPWNVTYKENSVESQAVSVAADKYTFTINPASVSILDVYTYLLGKVTDNNGCFATSLTGFKKANVYKVPEASAGADLEKCGPKVTLEAVPSVGTGIWTFPASVTLSDATNPNSDASFDPALITGKDLTYKFVWEETNWQCKNKDSVNVTFDRPIVKVDAGKPDTTFYTIDNIIHMTGNIPEAWETGTWSVVAGSGIFADETIYNTTVEGLGTENTFKWTIENGKCSAEDNIIVYVSEIIIPRGISPGNDGENDTLKIKGLDLQNQDAELRILTGTGAEVYSTYKKGENINTWKDWYGQNSRGVDLPDGTYYFVLRLTSKNPGSSSVHKETGYIILKRNRN